ncbi:hypothetical protein OC846_002505 [Tilletia horrida]|uniref:NAD(P)-binding protein n=1 Tax=Tilletia horrida TaxID=155126 RepID=A0AAN6GRR9_9BASI|nr:hypothetical protein OC845_003372 [Tilletia horrida]KAK0553456.1 hypothetical protein OC846_002505 [Tilletia horrida]KAK0568010.1 hypothetical protein OC861_002392 [Tilletia horrida]
MTASPCVLLTGASRGIGLATLRILLELPSSLGIPTSTRPNIVAISRSLTPELKDLALSHSDRVEIVQGDVQSPELNQQAVAKARTRFGRLDALILNAGILGMGRLGDVSGQTFSDVININLVSLHTTVQAALPLLRSSPDGLGRVVLVSSGAATAAVEGWGAYCISKAAAVSLGRMLAVEEKKLAVWSIRPGKVDTEMQGLIRSDGAQHMEGQTQQSFADAHRDGKLVPPPAPAHVLVALALRGSREQPQTASGSGAGAEGAFLSWDSPELQGWRAD